MSEQSSEIGIGQYLLERLKQLGVTAVFGVPGDFTLTFLDLIEDDPSLEWLGFCNELNASYAADGYERVPILHIVGVPSTKLQAHRALLHHTLGDNRFDAFSGVATHITAAQALLTSADNNANGASAAAEIDRVLRTALLEQRPTYLTLPTDLVFAKISRKALGTPLTSESIIKQLSATPHPEDMVKHVVARIKELFVQAKKPIMIVDACARRFHVLSETKALIEAAGVPWFSTPMAKAVFSEQHPLFSGVYIGDVSFSEVIELVDSADLSISVGSLKSDFNTGSFSYRMTADKQIELHSDHVIVQYARYEIGFHVLLPLLVEALKDIPHPDHFTPLKNGNLKAEASTGTLSQEKLWPHLAHFFKPEDIILAETGTSSFGILDALVPGGAVCHAQVLWGSIGYATGASVGMAYAAKELGRRLWLLTGEGSCQVTVQDLAQMMRLGLNPVLCVLNNAGYTIERQIHGATRKYNDVPAFDWQHTLTYLGAKDGESQSYSVKTGEELSDVLGKQVPANEGKVQLVEIHLAPDDAPRALKMQAGLSAKANAE